MPLTEGVGGFLSVSAATPATFSSAGYAALTWTEVGETSELPEFGATCSAVTFTPIETGIVNKFHGERNYGSITIPLAYDYADAGQNILRAALASEDEISFRESRTDGTVRYIMGKVMSFPRGQSVGSVNMASCNIEFTRADVEVPPLFIGGRQGVLLEAFDIGTLFQLSGGTTLVTVATDPIGYFGDKSGNDNHATQATAAARPTYQTGPARATIDKVEDRLSVTVPAGGFTGTMVLATDQGTASYGVTIPAGLYDIGGRGGLYFPGNAIVGQLIRDGALSKGESSAIEAYFVDNGATASYGAVTSFNNFWRAWSEITSFPLIDTSAGTNFNYAWSGCNSLTSFPLIDTSAGTDFDAAWRGCTSLTSFPLIDTSSGTDFVAAWRGCTSLTSFPLIDMSAGANFSYAWYDCTSLTSFPLIDTSAGTSFSRAWRGCTSLTSFPLIDMSAGANFSYAWYDCTSLTSFPLIDTSSGTDFVAAWRGCTSLTSFPLIDTSAGTSFSLAWRNCTSLTSFPLIDTSSGTRFNSAWLNCTSLTSFPLLDTSSGTNFARAWRNCSSLTSFPLLDTSAGDNFNNAWYDCTSLTSFPLIDTSSGTNFARAWQNCSSLTSFPLIDTSAGTRFSLAWYNCTSLTSFPLIDTSAGTRFNAAWRNCTSLTSFPANAFDNVSGGNFTGAFTNTALTQTSIDNILVSLVTSGIATETRVFDQSGGSAPSSTGEAAIDTLRSRGWTVTVTGGY